MRRIGRGLAERPAKWLRHARSTSRTARLRVRARGSWAQLGSRPVWRRTVNRWTMLLRDGFGGGL